MKAGTLFVPTVLGLVVFVFGCGGAQPIVVNPSAVDARVAGSSFTIDVSEVEVVIPAATATTPPTTSTVVQSTTIHDLVATGESGTARVNALLVAETHDRKAADTASRENPSPGCTSAYPYGVKVVSFTWVQTYDDGSAFTGAIDEKRLPNAVLCTNGSDFVLTASGIIIHGQGPRFENLVGGSWEAEATIANYLTTGTFKGTRLHYQVVKR